MLSRMLQCFCSVVVVGFLMHAIAGADGTPVRISNLNWHSADIMSSAIAQLLKSRAVSVATNVSAPEYTSSAVAVDAVRTGHLDIVSECWELCSGDGIVSQSLGVLGLEGVYIPGYLAKQQPALIDWNTSNAARLLRGAGVHLLGPPRMWATSWSIIHNISAALGIELQTPISEMEHLSEILQGLKLERRFAFYFWEPHMIPSAYDLVRVHLPDPPRARNDTFETYFTLTDLQMVWSSSIHSSTAGAVLDSGELHTSKVQIDRMLQTLTNSMSFRQADGTNLYEQAVASTALRFLCEDLEVLPVNLCMEQAKWPRQKSLSFPPIVKIETKNCPGFSICREGSTELLRPSGGYAVDHIHQIMHLIGYQRHEYYIKCFQGAGGTNGLIRHTSLELADLAHACITISSQRQQLVDFTSPFYSTGLQAMILMPDNSTWWHLLFSLFLPFHWTTWTCLVLLTVVVGCGVGVHEGREHFVRARGKKEQKTAESANMSAGDCEMIQTPSFRSTIKSIEVLKESEAGLRQRAAIFEGVQTSAMMITGKLTGYKVKDFARKLSMSGKTAMMALSASSTFLLSLYTAALAASLTVRRLDVPINGVEDLRGKSVAIVCNTTVESWLKQYEPNIDVVCFPSQSESVNAVSDKIVDAMVYDAPVLEQLAANDPNCRFMVVGSIFALQEYGIALPKNHPLLDAVSAAVTHLREENAHKTLYDKHFSGRCKAQETEIVGETDVIPPAYLLSFLPIAAIAILYCVLHTICMRCGGLCCGKLSADPERDSGTHNKDKHKKDVEALPPLASVSSI